MERYIGTKIIAAEPMSEAEFAQVVRPLGTIRIDSQGNSRPGYKVVYEDGYTSWSPQEVFERAYRRITDAEFALIVGADPQAKSEPDPELAEILVNNQPRKIKRGFYRMPELYRVWP